MFLSKLQIHGFKSFANKLTLDFSQQRGGLFPITAVVGPNGSGKSNVVDAIRWVLGEQSMKHLRGKKHEDIIFSGSETKSRLGYAEVAMTFDNSDHVMPVDLAEVVITRRLYRDGESEYLLNNRAVRLSDITMLLAQSHMGQRTYAVIGQGMVDHLLLATPKERKEMIDEAAGVRPYQIKRAESMNRLETARTNLLQAQTVLAEIEPRLRTLTRMVKRLERRAELEREIATIKKEYYGALWRSSTEGIAAVHKKISELEPRARSLTMERDRTREQLKTLEHAQPASTKLIELQRLFETATSHRESLNQQYWSLKTKMIAPVSAVVLNLQEELEHVVAEYDTLIDTLDSKDPTSILSHFSKLLQHLKGLVKRARSKSTPVPPQSDPTSPELEAIQKKLTAAKDHLDQLKSQMKSVEEEEKKSRTAIFALQDTLRASERELESVQRTLTDVGMERVRLETRHEDLAQEIRRAMNGEPAVVLAPPLPRSNTPLPELEREMRRLEHEIELIGGIDPEVTKEYATTNERFTFLSKESEDLTAAINELQTMIEHLDTTMRQQFERAFDTISKEFSRYFQELFGGGKAQLMLLEPEPEKEKELDDQEEPSQATERQESSSIQNAIAGIDIHASPPGKRLKSVSVLSGGEKALTAIALLCAILSFHPSPFVVLDEVDAALDEANSHRYASILKRLAEKTQFIVITHNRTTMHIAQTFYGVTMGSDGISQILSMKLEEAEEAAPAS